MIIYLLLLICYLSYENLKTFQLRLDYVLTVLAITSTRIFSGDIYFLAHSYLIFHIVYSQFMDVPTKFGFYSEYH